MCYLQAAMAEASSSEQTPKKTPAKGEKAKGASRRTAPQEAGPFARLSTWSVVGALLLGGVVVWRLWGSSYKGDVRTICNAEKGSGFTIDKDMPKVTQWIRSNLETPEGNTLFSTLTDTRLTERGKKLQGEATAVNVAACPMVSSYERLAAEGEYRTDLQRLCSSLTFPRLSDMVDDERLAKIEDFIDKQAKSPRTKELAEPLRSAPAAGRAKVLRDATQAMDVFSCETAKTLDTPQAERQPAGPPMVRVWSAPQVIGPLKEEDLAKALVEITPAMNDCYQKGVEKKPDLVGRVSIKMQVDPDGKVMKVAPADLAFDDHDVLGCLVGAIKSMKLPKNNGPVVSVLIPLELTTRP
jgi:hypothetical protein